MAFSFKDSNSSAEISSHPLALLTAVLLKVHLTSQFTMSGSGWLIIHCSHMVIRSFLFSSFVHSFQLILISSGSTRSLPCLSFLDVSNFPEEITIVFPLVLFFFSIIKHYSLKKACLSLLKITPVSLVSSLDQLCPIYCDLMSHSTPGLPVHHQLSEFIQIHVHWVSDAI